MGTLNNQNRRFMPTLTYDPLTLEDFMRIPTAKAQLETNIQQNADILDTLLSFQRQPGDDELVRQIGSTYRNDLSSLADKILSSDFSLDNLSAFKELRGNIRRDLSPEGTLGKIMQRNSEIENFKKVLATLKTQQGFTGDAMDQMLAKFTERNPSTFTVGEDGSLSHNQFKPYYGPNMYDPQKDMMDISARAGTIMKENGYDGYKITEVTIDGNKVPIMEFTKQGKVVKSNDVGINNALKYLYKKYNLEDKMESGNIDKDIEEWKEVTGQSNDRLRGLFTAGSDTHRESSTTQPEKVYDIISGFNSGSGNSTPDTDILAATSFDTGTEQFPNFKPNEYFDRTQSWGRSVVTLGERSDAGKSYMFNDNGGIKSKEDFVKMAKNANLLSPLIIDNTMLDALGFNGIKKAIETGTSAFTGTVPPSVAISIGITDEATLGKFHDEMIEVNRNARKLMEGDEEFQKMSDKEVVQWFYDRRGANTFILKAFNTNDITRFVVDQTDKLFETGSATNRKVYNAENNEEISTEEWNNVLLKKANNDKNHSDKANLADKTHSWNIEFNATESLPVRFVYNDGKTKYYTVPSGAAKGDLENIAKVHKAMMNTQAYLRSNYFNLHGGTYITMPIINSGGRNADTEAVLIRVEDSSKFKEIKDKYNLRNINDPWPQAARIEIQELINSGDAYQLGFLDFTSSMLNAMKDSRGSVVDRKVNKTTDKQE